MLKALIFDVDGTLANTERDGHRLAFNAAFRDLGLDWHWDIPTYGELLAITGGKERITHYATHNAREFIAAKDFSTTLQKLHAAKTRHYLQLIAEQKINLRLGVKELLHLARSHDLTLAIATTTSPENVFSLLRASLHPDAISWFAVIAAGDIVPAKKPAPDIYNFTLHELGLTASDCLAFEDSAHGLQSALGAGIATVVTPNEYTKAQSFDRATTLLPDLYGIDIALLQHWHAQSLREST